MTPAQSKIKLWRENPVQFVRDNFGVEPDAWQVDVLMDFGNQNEPKLRQSMQACVGPGKSAVLAWCGWNFLSCYGEPGHHPKGAVVSVTEKNLKDNLWPEYAKWQSRSPYLLEAFQWTKERIFAKDHDQTWFLSARSWNKDADAETQGRTLSGLHSKYVIVQLDESGEIPPPVLKAGEQALAETDCKIARIQQAGNPSSLDGVLYLAANQLAHLWKVYRITGDPDDPKRSRRIDIEWAREQIKQYGRDNPWVMYSILGLFPPTSINSLLGPDQVRAAMSRTLRADAYEFTQKRLGIDVAFEGDDTTVLFPRQGLAAFKFVTMKNAKSADIAARVMMAKKNFGSEMEFIDDTGGWSKGVQEFLAQAGIATHPVNFSGKAIDPRYYNIRAEMYWNMSEWVKNGGALPYDEQLLRELCAPTYTLRNGKILLEDKKQIKARLGFSPDIADALALTFSLPDMPAALNLGIPGLDGPNKMLTEWDPYR